MKGYLGKIKVNQKVKPIAQELREIPNLGIGISCYVSFANNLAYPCRIVEITNKPKRKEVKIEVPMKSKSGKGDIDTNGMFSYNWTSTHLLYANEIGNTPEQAVLNMVG